jgi:hypothetical protein
MPRQAQPISLGQADRLELQRWVAAHSTPQQGLLLARDTPIHRYVKVKSEANPCDPVYETYVEKREADRMQDTFQGSRFLRSLWYEQGGLCVACNTRLTRLSRVDPSLLHPPPG